MRIIERGSEERVKEYKRKHNLIKRFECEICGCVFEASLANGEVKSSQYDGVYTYCPFCNQICYNEFLPWKE